MNEGGNEVIVIRLFFKIGFWEYNTYGIFALYKSDWTVVGGFDVVKYTTKWGGEDWELLDRLVERV